MSFLEAKRCWILDARWSEAEIPLHRGYWINMKKAFLFDPTSPPGSPERLAGRQEPASGIMR